MTEGWIARARPTSPGWIRVPAGLSGAAVDAWVAESLSGLQEQWGPEWRDEDTDQSAELLRRAVLERTEDKVLDLLFWPFARPVVVRVNVRVYPSIPLASWIDEGFEIDGFDSADMGPAVRCITQADVEVDGQQKRLITAHFVFDDGSFQVQVEVEPTFVELYAHVAFELVNLVAGLEVSTREGDRFVPRPAPGYTLADVDTFTSVDDA